MDAWAIHPLRLFDLVTATVALVMALTVLRASPRKPANQAFALFMLLIAGNFVAGFATWGVQCPDQVPGSLYGTSCFGLFRISERLAFQFQVFDPAALLYFSLLFPRRDAWLDRPAVLLGLWGPPVAFTLVAFAAPWAFVSGRLDYPWEPTWSLTWTVEVYLAIAYLGALGLLLRNLGREQSDLLRGQLALLVVGFGVAVLPRLGLAVEAVRSQLLPMAFSDPLTASSLFLFRAAPTVLATALVCRHLLRMGPDARVHRAARYLAGLVAFIALIWLVSQLTAVYGTAFIDLGTDVFSGLVFSLRWVVFALVVGYALLRYQVMDVAVGIRQLGGRAITATLLAAVALLAWNGGPLVERIVGQVGLGQALALVLVAVAAPVIFRVGRQVGERVLPRVGTGDERSRRLEAYRASLEASLRDGAVPPEQETELRGLRRDLGITEEQHQVLLGIVRLGKRGAGRAAAEGDGLLGGRYELGRVLGRGSFGQCRLARDALLGRTVVIKEVPGVGGANLGVLGEARAAGRMSHPNIVTVFDVLESPGMSYLVMEHAERGNLREVLRGTPPSPQQARRLLEDILAGLAAAHGRGIVHGDLKPENILIDAEGRAKLADFGSAHAKGAGTMMSLPSRAGPATLLYMAPEQVRGESASVPSDLYAVAAVAHELVSGEHYFDTRGKGDFDLREAILRARPRSAGAGRAWDAWLARGLAKAPADRFAGAEAMLRSMPPEEGASRPGTAVRSRRRR